MKVESKNNKETEYSTFQSVLLFIIPVAFIALSWRMIPVSNLMKVFFCCLFGTVVFYVVVIFSESLSFFDRFRSSWAAITVTAIVFLAFPAINNVVYTIHEKEYLTSYPTNNMISVKITYEINRTGGSGSIGNEWTYNHFLNDQSFKNGDTLKINANSPFSITSQFIERDSISDVGETTSSKYKYSSNNNYKKTLTISQNVHVVEQGGRKYAGSTADFNVIYTLKRVIPASMDFWDILLFTPSSPKYNAFTLLVLGQVVSILAIPIVLIFGKRKKSLADAQARFEKEQAFLLEKNAFLLRLNGQTIRQVAGVPANISFVNGLPVDNNNAPYGSFTVYRSSNGTCYHNKRGCCSARYPIHYFNAKNQYRPCSKCCDRSRSIPKWYNDYKELKNKAKYYQVDVIDKD